MKIFAILFPLVVLLMVVLLVLPTALHQSGRADKFETTGRLAPGHVVGFYYAKKSGRLYLNYEYNISGQTFRGTSNRLHLDRRPEVGMPVEVTYLPDDPGTSTLNVEAERGAANQVIYIPIVVIGAIVLMLILLARRKSRARSI